MDCWKCGTNLEEPPFGKVPFRALCDQCNAWLHCCKNCRNYKPGLPNDCMIPGTEHIADREGRNFCEDFVLLGKPLKQEGGIESVSQRLFGEKPSQKKNFNDLFHD